MQLESYEKPSWENFTGFVKDTAHMVERYLIKNQIRPLAKVRHKYKNLKAAQKRLATEPIPQIQALTGRNSGGLPSSAQTRLQTDIDCGLPRQKDLSADSEHTVTEDDDD